MRHVSSLVQSALPWLSPRAHSLVEALFVGDGSVGKATDVARQLGLASRFALARFLRKERLPPLHRLSGYACVLHWMWQWEQDGVPLSRSALQAGKEPAAAYRLVRQVTGRTWTAACQGGFGLLLVQFLQECDGPEHRVEGTTVAGA